jgi:putative intracellular protease/amidase
MAKVLIVLTSHGVLGNTGTPTGFYFEEMATPYYIFEDAGHSVELASIAGGKPPHDPKSLDSDLEKQPGSVRRFLKDAAAMFKLETTSKIDAVAALDYDAVFLAGGHGAMWDFPNSQALADVVSKIYQDGGTVAAVCHGPAGLLNAKTSEGEFLLDGVVANGFSNAEEDKAGLTAVMPFLLENVMIQRGAKYQSGPAFTPYSVSYFRIVTGQNPMSSEKTAHEVLANLITPQQKIHAT